MDWQQHLGSLVITNSRYQLVTSSSNRYLTASSPTLGSLWNSPAQTLWRISSNNCMITCQEEITTNELLLQKLGNKDTSSIRSNRAYGRLNGATGSRVRRLMRGCCLQAPRVRASAGHRGAVALGIPMFIASA